MTASSSASLRLTRAMRLQERREFAQVRSQGQRLVKGCLIANWMALPGSAISRLGLVTSRQLGNAVARTRARRLLREAFRLHQQDLRLPVVMVLVARQSIAGKRYAQVEYDYLNVLRQANLLKTTK
ncbi:MAG: ribonuclease P protein component [Verrucomicrobiota bacterium]